MKKRFLLDFPHLGSILADSNQQKYKGALDAFTIPLLAVESRAK